MIYGPDARDLSEGDGCACARVRWRDRRSCCCDCPDAARDRGRPRRAGRELADQRRGHLLEPNGDRVLRDLRLDGVVGDAGFRVEMLRIMDAAGTSMGEFPFGLCPGVGAST